MSSSNFVVKKTGTFVCIALASMTLWFSPARGELVFDDEAAAQEQNEASNPVITDGTPTERESVRQVLQSADKAQATDSQGETAESRDQPAVENLSRAELLRRERLRRELQNEDLLQVRLEELRLRDEARRTKELLGGELPEAKTSQEVGSAPVEQQVISPELEKMAQPPAQIGSSPAAPVTPFPQDQVVATQAAPAAGSATEAAIEEGAAESTRIILQPRGGVANTLEHTDQVKGRFGAGVGASVEVSESLFFDVGYMYAEYGVNAAVTNPAAAPALYYSGTSEPFVMKQNVIDAGIKMSLLGKDSKLRPFVGGGAAYGKSFINYDQRALDALSHSGQRDQAADYEVNGFMGYLSTGFDLRLSKAVSVGATFKYYAVLSSRENQSFENFAYNNYTYPNYVYPYGGAYSYGMDSDKQAVGSSLARVNFYSILAGVSFIF